MITSSGRTKRLTGLFLLGYLLFDLKAQGRDLHRYVRNVEEVIIRCLAEFRIQGERNPPFPGVWVGDEKICSLGISVHHWITKHGFALNVNNNLDHFSFIHPCGIIDRGVTSMSKLLNKKLSQEDVVKKVVTHFSNVFGVPVERGDDIGEILKDYHWVNIITKSSNKGLR